MAMADGALGRVPRLLRVLSARSRSNFSQPGPRILRKLGACIFSISRTEIIIHSTPLFSIRSSLHGLIQL